MGKTKKNILIAVGIIILLGAIIGLIAGGCVLQTKSEWRNRNNTNAEAGKDVVVYEISQTTTTYSKILVKAVNSKLVEEDNYDLTKIYYVASVYFYNVAVEDGVQETVYYVYTVGTKEASTITKTEYEAVSSNVISSYAVDQTYDVKKSK